MLGFLCSILTLLILPHGFSASQPYEIKPGDHVLFYGDSITEQRLYTSFVETYTITRFPTLNAIFTNSGWGGDRVTGGYGGNITTRLNRDLYPFNPNVVTIMLGMNDGRNRAFEQETYDTYANGLASIVKDIRSKLPGARITLIEPSPYDDYTREPRFPGGYNAVLLKYGEYVRNLAKENGLLCADLNAPVVLGLKRAYLLDPKGAQDIIRDRIHPQPGGHLLMAAELLKAWNAPAIVTYVEIDASAPSAKAANTKLSGLKFYKDGLVKWTQLDAALPFPIDFREATIALAIKVSDFIQTLNQQLLIVKNLKEDYYELIIDEVSIGVYKKENFDKGINLAIENTPMLEQAQKVHNLTVLRNNVRRQNWRNIEVPNKDAKNIDEVVRDLRTGELALVKLQQELARPLPRHYTLRPSSAEAALGRSILGPEQPPVPQGYNPENLALKKTCETTDLNRSSTAWGATTSLTDGSWEAKAGSTFCTGNGRDFPKHVTIDLQTTQTLGCIIAGVPPFGSTRTIIVSLSMNGKKFNTVGEYVFSQAKEEKRTFIFRPQEARYIRLTYADKYEERVGYYDPQFMFTTEVEAYTPVK